MIRLAQAASSEYFSAWGEPPNTRRTGVTKDKPEGNMDGELSVVPFADAGWTSVFRPVKDVVADKIAWIMERAVANWQYIGYGQNNGQYPRTGVYDELMKMSNPDPMAIKKLVNCDCSSLVGAACYFAGVYAPQFRNMSTSTERQYLLGTGEFVEIKDAELLRSGRGVKRGDIFFKVGHTCVATGTDLRVEYVPARVSNCVTSNLRTGPGTEYQIIKVLPSGKRVELVSRSSNGWGQVRVDGIFGYISPKYHEILPTATAKGDVWMRSDAGKKYEGVIVIPKNATVYLTGNTKKVSGTTWYECDYAGKEGYASGKYIKA